METNALKVMLWDDVAGYLTWDKSASVALFEYEPYFLTKNIDFAPLTMSVLSPRSQNCITLLNRYSTKEKQLFSVKKIPSFGRT